MPRLRRVVAVAAVALACDHPTAPPRSRPEPTAQPDALGAGFRSDLGRIIAQALFSPRVFPSGPLDVQHDGSPGRYVAVVMERVYPPPAGSGGAPYARRMLMAWDPESHREFAFESDDSVSTIIPPAPNTFAASGLNGFDHHWGN